MQSVIFIENENWVVATDITLHITTQGKTREEALQNLKEAQKLYYEETPNK